VGGRKLISEREREDQKGDKWIESTVKGKRGKGIHDVMRSQEYALPSEKIAIIGKDGKGERGRTY